MPKRQREGFDEPETPAKRPRTRSVTQPDRQAAERARLEEERRIAEELRLRREAAIAAQPVAPPGNRGDGNLHLAFIQMGQGDSSIISTPKGRTILIDCGSDSTEEDDSAGYLRRIRDTLYGPKFLRNHNILDVLILTHPDSDHYNKLSSVLDDGIRIQSLYHSDLLAHYSAAQTSGWLQDRMENARFIKAITLNNASKLINGVVVQRADDNNKVGRLDAQEAIRIVDEDNCKISILASNVTAYANITDNSNDTNRGSVVTLIECFGKKIMICGDATLNTEKFILDKYDVIEEGDDVDLAGRIGFLDIVQVPHHGSSYTSSSDGFVGTVHAKKVIVSAGKKIPMHHHPHYTTIAKYLGPARDKEHEHELSFWKEGGINSYYHESGFIKKEIYITGSNGTQAFTIGP